MRANTNTNRRDPFLAQLDSQFDSLVRQAFGGTLGAAPTGAPAPAAETRREGDDAVIRVDLPGVDLADVSVELKDRRLLVSGERRDDRAAGDGEEQGRRLAEIRYGSFSRAFRVGQGVTAEAVTASYDRGVLTVRVAGAYAAVQGQRIEITGPVAQD